MPITRAEVALVGKDQTAAAFRNVVRNADTAQRQITQKFRQAFNLLGIGAAIFALTRSVSGAIKAGDDLAKFAEKSGLAAEAASELAHAAKMQDIELGSLATGLKKMQVTLSEAGTGTKSATATLKALGLTFEQLKALNPDQQFELIAEQISKLKDPADRTRAAVELFGRAGADLLPLFTDGAAGIRRAREEAERLGKSFSAADLKTFQDADDAIKTMKASASGLADTLALKTGPAITTFFDNLRIAIGGGTERENAIENIEGQIVALSRAGEHAGPRLDELRAKLELLMNPMQDPLAGRGRVAKAGSPVVGFLKEVEDQAKLSKSELEKLEIQMNRLARFQLPGGKQVTDPRGRTFTVGQLRPEVATSEAALVNQSLGGSMEENAAAISRSMREVIANNIQATSRVVDLSNAFKIADESANGLMATIKDEVARQSFTTIRDLIYDFSRGADNFGERMLDAIHRILADQATRQLFELFSNLGSKSGGGGFLSALGRGIGSLFGAGSGSSASGSFRGFAAHGMTLKPGEFAIAGEAGPEPVFGGPQGATIVPFGKMRGESVQRSVQIHAPLNLSVRVDGTTDRSITQGQIENAVRAGLGNYHEFWRDQLGRGAFA